jgi:hypothetical protein
MYFAKVKYNNDFCTDSSFSLTYSHIYCNINYIVRSYCNAFWFCSTIETSLFQLLRY